MWGFRLDVFEKAIVTNEQRSHKGSQEGSELLIDNTDGRGYARTMDVPTGQATSNSVEMPVGHLQYCDSTP
jgi:hypothetical protein